MVDIKKISNEEIEAWFDAQQASLDYYLKNDAGWDSKFVYSKANKIRHQMQGAMHILSDLFNIEMVHDQPGCRDKWAVLTPDLEDFIEDYYYEMKMDAEGEEDY
jgi:hypothetical protein